ncbi:MAG TPA: family 16 glycosylhydrolase [Candidatus Nanopelagicales bacterium]|nr:family 16 glycosylhydrolase [Candidatus Nanopelagicales bacterium]
MTLSTSTTDNPEDLLGAHQAPRAPRTRREQLDLAHLEDVQRRAQRREARRASVLAAARKRPVAALTALAAAAAVAATGLMVASGGNASASPNLVVNGGFEEGTTGWTVPSPAVLAITTGRASAQAGMIVNKGKVAKTIALNDQKNTVASTVKGTTYHAAVYVKATTAKQSVSLRVSEYAGSSLKGQGRTNLYLADTAWHQLSLDYTAATAGASLDVNVVDWKLPAGASFVVDDVLLTAPNADVAVVAPTSAAPTPSPSPTVVAAPVTSPTPTPVASTPPAPVATTSSPVATAPAANPAPAGWTLAWSDDFDGTAVDSTKWNVRNNDYLSYDLAYLTKNNVSVSNGSLFITAKKESMGGRNYTSGYLDTIGKMSQTYGRFEVRAKLPTTAGSSTGMWPAFWLRPDDGGVGEIDIMEAVGSSGSTTAGNTSQTIWYDYNGTYPRQGHGDVMPAPQATADWHVYALEWTPTTMSWYVDDRLVFTRSTTTTAWFQSAFSRNFNIRLNLQVGGSWPGAPDASTAFPQSYQVDYVRVYKAS